MSTALLNGEKGQFSLSGTLNFETVPKINREMNQLFSAQKAVTVDLKKVIYSDSSGLALLAEWTRKAKKNQIQISYINIPKQMKAIANMTGLSQILPLEQ